MKNAVKAEVQDQMHFANPACSSAYVLNPPLLEFLEDGAVQAVLFMPFARVVFK